MNEANIRLTSCCMKWDYFATNGSLNGIPTGAMRTNFSTFSGYKLVNLTATPPPKEKPKTVIGCVILSANNNSAAC